jgi:hypothetical protein
MDIVETKDTSDIVDNIPKFKSGYISRCSQCNIRRSCQKISAFELYLCENNCYMKSIKRINELLAIKEVTLKMLQEDKFPTCLQCDSIKEYKYSPVNVFGQICPQHYIEAKGKCLTEDCFNTTSDKYYDYYHFNSNPKFPSFTRYYPCKCDYCIEQLGGVRKAVNR